jgi:hypothetical protein
VKGPLGERLGDELEPPTNPGKTSGSGAGWKFTLGFILALLLIAGATTYAATHARPRPTPDESCAGHGGVRYLIAGGWATPDTATCRDGHAGNVYP